MPEKVQSKLSNKLGRALGTKAGVNFSDLKRNKSESKDVPI